MRNKYVRQIYELEKLVQEINSLIKFYYKYSVDSVTTKLGNAEIIVYRYEQCNNGINKKIAYKGSIKSSKAYIKGLLDAYSVNYLTV